MKRKPKDFTSKIPKSPSIFISDDLQRVEVFGGELTSDRCRKLAAWLIKAADWLDHQSERGK